MLQHFLLQITKHQVDTFLPGRRVPSCQLCVEWAGRQQEPLKLAHRVELLGAKEPFNFFLIRPPSLPLPPLRPPTPLHSKSMCWVVNTPILFYPFVLYVTLFVIACTTRLFSNLKNSHLRLNEMKASMLISRWRDGENTQQATVERSDGFSVSQSGRQMEDDRSPTGHPNGKASGHRRKVST